MAQIFTDDQLLELIHKQGLSQKQAAAALNVSEAAVSKRLRKIRVAVNNNTALFNAPRLLDRQVGQMEQLEALGRQTRDLLELVQTALHGEGQEYYDARTKLGRLMGPKGNLGTFLIQLQDQLRKQLDFYFTIQKEAYNIRQIKEFQETVLDEIKNIDPGVAKQIVQRLVEINAAHSSLDFGIDRE